MKRGGAHRDRPGPRWASRLYAGARRHPTYDVSDILSAAQYRVSRLREADVRLTWADPLSTALVGDPTPAELALLALSQHRFGRTDQAR